MADEEKTEEFDFVKDIKSIRGLTSKILEAMTRLKESNGTLEKRVKVLELEIPGLAQRQETLEKVIHMLMEGAPEKLKDFLEKAVDEPKDGDNKVEALPSGPVDADKEKAEESEEKPAAEVVG